jgi:hypothetical protein
VYEYVVEPLTLQHLPDHALLLVQSAPGGGRTISPVECDPAIVTLERVATTPLPDPPAPRQAIDTSGAAVAPQQPQAPYLPQWATPSAPEPPRTPLPYEPGPPPGYRTGPHPADQRPAMPPPGPGRPATRQPPPPRPPDGGRGAPGQGPPPPSGPPPLFGGRTE